MSGNSVLSIGVCSCICQQAHPLQSSCLCRHAGNRAWQHYPQPTRCRCRSVAPSVASLPRCSQCSSVCYVAKHDLRCGGRRCVALLSDGSMPQGCELGSPGHQKHEIVTDICIESLHAVTLLVLVLLLLRAQVAAQPGSFSHILATIRYNVWPNIYFILILVYLQPLIPSISPINSVGSPRAHLHHIQGQRHGLLRVIHGDIGSSIRKHGHPQAGEG